MLVAIYVGESNHTPKVGLYLVKGPTFFVFMISFSARDQDVFPELSLRAFVTNLSADIAWINVFAARVKVNYHLGARQLFHDLLLDNGSP